MVEISRQVVEAAEAALLLTDADGRVLLANRRARDLVGRDLTGSRLSIEDLQDDVPLAGMLAGVLSHARRGGPARDLVATTDETGPRFHWVSVTDAAECPSGERGWLVCVVDISEAVSLAPAIRRVFSQVSHDLRSPLTSIGGAAELLLSGRLGELPPAQRRLVAIVEEGTRRMAEILTRTKAELAHASAAGGERGE